jgi:site-specific DNA-cytosine methylase
MMTVVPRRARVLVSVFFFVSISINIGRAPTGDYCLASPGAICSSVCHRRGGRGGGGSQREKEEERRGVRERQRDEWEGAGGRERDLGGRKRVGGTERQIARARAQAHTHTHTYTHTHTHTYTYTQPPRFLTQRECWRLMCFSLLTCFILYIILCRHRASSRSESAVD